MTTERAAAALTRFLEDPAEAAFGELYSATERLVYTICLRQLRSEEDAADAFQGTYLRLLLIARDPAAKIEARRIPGLIGRLALLEADRVRKKRNRRGAKEFTVAELPRTPSKDHRADALAAREEMRRNLELAVEKLPDRYRLAVQLRYFHGMSVDDIAANLGKPSGTVSSLISRGLSQLEQPLKRAGYSGSADSLLSIVGGAALLAPPEKLAAAAVYHEAAAAAAALAHSGSAISPLAGLAAGGIAAWKIAAVTAGLIALGGFVSYLGVETNRRRASGSKFEIIRTADFTKDGDFGGQWSGSVRMGTAEAKATENGLCMTVPEKGDNEVSWVGPEAYIDLKPRTVYRLRVRLSTDQTLPDAIPLCVVQWDNFQSATGFINWGGDFRINDARGGAFGIGRAGAPEEFIAYFTPSAVATPQWNDEVHTGLGSHGAFSPEADAYNDIRLHFSVSDLGSGPWGADADSGTVCVRSIVVESIPIEALKPAETIYAAPITEANYEIVAAEGEAVAKFDPARGEARFQLARDTTRATAALRPRDPGQPEMIDADGDGAAETPNALRHYPVVYGPGELLRLRVRLRCEPAVAASPDPVDALRITMRTATEELIQTDNISRAAPGGIMDRVGSPIAAERTGGAGQTFTSFFYTHGGTRADGRAFPNASRLAPRLMLMNQYDLGGPGPSGGDPIVVEAIEIDRIELPE